jgi:hypothetical protein
VEHFPCLHLPLPLSVQGQGQLLLNLGPFSDASNLAPEKINNSPPAFARFAGFQILDDAQAPSSSTVVGPSSGDKACFPAATLIT